jgi:hypothetical protein
MINFYIKRITALGKDRKDAVIELTEGFNIICGLSDTGKSCVLLCIDFIFGGDEPPFDESNTGYDKVRVLIETPNGLITLERELGKNKIVVSSTDRNVTSGKYDCKYSARSNYPTISSLFLRLIGIEDEHNIIRNKDFVTDRLTWRTFLHTFLIKEERVYEKQSILLPERKEANTLLFSALIFLMTGQDFAGVDKREEKRIRDAKKNEIIRHINLELSELADRKKDLEARLSEYAGVAIGERVRAVIAEVSALKERIEAANERGKVLLGKMMEVRAEQTDCDILAGRYAELRKRFIADIKRLTLIVDGEAKMEDMPTPEKCPFCGGEICEHEQEGYIETSRAELTRIITQYDGLSQAELDVAERKNNTERELAQLEGEKTDIDALINERLKPKERELSDMLSDYQTVTRLQGELDFIQRFADERSAELREKETADEESKLEYLPKEHFDSRFRENFDKYLTDMFGKCNFEGLVSAHFDFNSKFDVSINGKIKATTRGKGYRAYINTALALTFRKYLLDNGKFNSGVFFVDSPLLTLKQGVDDQAPESMKSALFRYLLENQGDGQTLVIENEIPELNYADYGVEPIRFTGGKSEGRYGFLWLDGQY